MSQSQAHPICTHCGQVIIDGPATVVAVSHVGERGPEFSRFLLCPDCGQECLRYLSQRRTAPTPTPAGPR